METRDIRRKEFSIALLLCGLLLFLAGYCVAPRHPHEAATGEGEAPAEEGRILYWSCSMHPQINLPEKGKCPICSMDLIPIRETAKGGAGLVLAPVAREMIAVETSSVASVALRATVRLIGKIDYDETRLAHVAAWVPGRIEELHVNYVGAKVAKGDPLFTLYSPELRAAQEEHLIAHRRWKAVRDSGDEAEIESALAIRDGTRKRLELWGILPAEIETIETSGRAGDRATIHAPASGTVTMREAFQGKYVSEGERVFSIADLSVVWANLDAYEIDLAGLREGRTVRFEAEALPGESFEGKIAFIPPVLDERTRTVKLRVEVPNPGERLRPGMFVRAAVEVPIGEAGERVLSIPASAPLLSGTRAIVYVEELRGDEIAYVGREIALGPRSGDRYAVRSGLAEGERVVTRGNFKIDAALQIQAKPSLMAPAPGAARIPTHAVPPSFDPVLAAYLDMVEAAAADDGARALAAFGAAREALARVKGEEVREEARGEFANLVAGLRSAMPAEAPRDLAALRIAIAPVSASMRRMLGAFAHRREAPLFEAFCPMALGGKGALWIQAAREIRNPYFGSSMLECGEIRSEIAPAAKEGGS